MPLKLLILLAVSRNFWRYYHWAATPTTSGPTPHNTHRNQLGEPTDNEGYESGLSPELTTDIGTVSKLASTTTALLLRSKELRNDDRISNPGWTPLNSTGGGKFGGKLMLAIFHTGKFIPVFPAECSCVSAMLLAKGLLKLGFGSKPSLREIASSTEYMVGKFGRSEGWLCQQSFMSWYIQSGASLGFGSVFPWKGGM